MTREARQYCHILRFPNGWIFPRIEPRTGQTLFFGTERSDYEFRVEGSLSTKFLVAGFTEFVGVNNYTSNHYIVDLANAASPALPVTNKAWDAGAVVPLIRKNALGPGKAPSAQTPLMFHGIEFSKSGQIWDQSFAGAGRPSPDQEWLVLQSYTLTSGSRAQVFFDFFNADSGQRLFTVDGAFSDLHGDNDPEGVLRKTAWVTERYFIIPLGKSRDRCLVCDFGKKEPQKGSKQ